MKYYAHKDILYDFFFDIYKTVEEVLVAGQGEIFAIDVNIDPKGIYYGWKPIDYEKILDSDLGITFISHDVNSLGCQSDDETFTFNVKPVKVYDKTGNKIYIFTGYVLKDGSKYAKKVGDGEIVRLSIKEFKFFHD